MTKDKINIMKGEAKNNKKVFDKIFSDLFENKIIYHERVTVLCDVDRCDVSELGFRIWLRPLRLLYQNKHRPHFYDGLVERQIFSLGSVFDFDNCPLFDGKKIGRPYCPFTLWPNKELVEQVSNMNSEELEEKLYNMLWD